MVRQSITRILAGSTSFDEAVPLILDAVGRSIGAGMGRYWQINSPGGALLCAHTWHAVSDPRLPSANDASLPGRACVTKSVVCVNADGRASELPEPPSAIAFPIMVDDVLGVIEFCRIQMTEPDGSFSDLLADIGSELGQFVLRQQAEAALRANEHCLHTIVNSSSNALIAIDESGTITGWDRQAERMLGWSKEKAIGERLEEKILPERYRHDYRATLERVLKTGDGPLLNSRIATTALHRNGKEFPAELMIAPISTGTGSISIVFLRDISDGVRSSITLREQLAEMEQLLSIVVHDLRRPMLSFYALLGTLQEEWADKPEAKANIELLFSECKRMNQMVSQLIDISNIDRVEIKREPVHLRRMIDGIVEKYRPQMTEKQANVRIECPDVEAMISRAHVEACIEQLLNNAFDYGCPRPNCCINIRCSINGSQAIISVGDEGPGIALADQQRAFELFRRLKNSLNINGSGTGLTRVQKHMKTIGGTVALNSALGAGAQFVLTFPCD